MLIQTGLYTGSRASMARQRHELITDYSDRKLRNHRETPVSAVAVRGRDIKMMPVILCIRNPETGRWLEAVHLHAPECRHQLAPRSGFLSFRILENLLCAEVLARLFDPLPPYRSQAVCSYPWADENARNCVFITRAGHLCAKENMLVARKICQYNARKPNLRAFNLHYHFTFPYATTSTIHK